ncbi:hypothetical protein KKE60_08900 [Patescibacteria group bacterium]|nr:hypothetical protein [Patescibacteria group bacterium]
MEDKIRKFSDIPLSEDVEQKIKYARKLFDNIDIKVIDMYGLRFDIRPVMGTEGMYNKVACITIDKPIHIDITSFCGLTHVFADVLSLDSEWGFVQINTEHLQIETVKIGYE